MRCPRKNIVHWLPLLENKYVRRSFVLILALYCSKLRALSLEFPVDQLLDSSSDVAIIEIIRGQKIERNGTSCGNSFVGRVNDILKGSSSKAVVFGDKNGLEIGKRYLVVLVTKITYIEQMNSLFPMTRNYYLDDTKADQEFNEWKSCQMMLPNKMVAAFGLAAMPIEEPSEFGYMTPAVKVPLSIWLPPGTKCTKAISVSDYDKGREVVWITPDELRRVFKEVIDRPQGAKIVGGPGKYPISPKDCDEPVKPL